MNFGVVLQTNPPAARVIELARRAETYGFSHAWTFDSHLLWEEPFVIYSRILDATHKLTVGPMVTNPATRDWTVTASLFATLNEMYGNRTVCGIGRGDSAVRVINGKPVKLADLRACIEVIRGLANGEAVQYKGATCGLLGTRPADFRSGSRPTDRKRSSLRGRSATASSCSSRIRTLRRGASRPCATRLRRSAEIRTP
jgi:alkanesulfonate monooxygenase SsuD/methylene tetrahydromethanopterin reductase-like flavin-dependent oxidoreductase (luciferase family)